MNEREHAPYHERRLEQQQLDALLRIEELLKAFLVLLPVEETGPSVNARGEINPEPKPKGKRR
jgi:hypothetical protein